MKELDAVLAKELENCGSQKAQIKKEADAARTKAEAHAKGLIEKRKKDEETRKEIEKKRAETLEKNGKLVAELVLLAEAAEEASVLDFTKPLPD